MIDYGSLYLLVALANGVVYYWNTCDLVNRKTYKTSLPAFRFKIIFR